jgi:hypothetical protein
MPTTPYTIRGPKIPLAWSTVKAEGYVVEKADDDAKCDQVLIDDEDGVYNTEISKLREMSERSIEVMPLSGLSEPPVAGDIFTYGAKKISVLSIKESRAKSQAMKWTISGNFVATIHT